ncbi:MAG TPA: hypothetical protein VLX68_04400 [Chitinivibrionales bacterium]|nr:hypothetical protein [Chitinivibrionales bacterium]
MRLVGLDKEIMAACSILVVGLSFATCTNSPVRSAPAALIDLHVAAPAPGWVESAGAFQEFGDTDVYNLLYDSVYLMNNAVRNGFHTSYENAAETTTVNVVIIDYGTAADAFAVWDTLKHSRADMNHPVTMPDFSASAEGSQTYNGLVVYSCFGRFYFQLTFNNYPDPNRAVADAEAFLGKYKAIAEK